MMIKEVIKKIIKGDRYDSESYIARLRKLGVEIGDDCIIYVPSKTLIDEQYPWMISIGDHVRITQGVLILTHDFSWSVLKTTLDPDDGAPPVLGAAGRVVIGDNVFIGMNAIITRGAHIGDNTVIGAGSVVTGVCEPNSVYAGAPARKISTIDRFREKRVALQVVEARDLAIGYRERFGVMPPIEVFHEFFCLFADDETIRGNSKFSSQMELCGNASAAYAAQANFDRPFKDYDEFLRFCFTRAEN